VAFFRFAKFPFVTNPWEGTRCFTVRKPTNEGPDPQGRTEAERELQRAIAEELKNRKPLPIELQEMWSSKSRALASVMRCNRARLLAS